MEDEFQTTMQYLKEIEGVSKEMKDSQHNMAIQVMVAFIIIVKIAILIIKMFYDKRKAAVSKLNEKKQTQEILHNISRNLKEVKQLTSSRHLETKKSDQNLDKDEKDNILDDNFDANKVKQQNTK